MPQMKKSSPSVSSPVTSVRELGAAQLRQIRGGALNAYITPAKGTEAFKGG
jgi:hypothetical protein